MREYVTFLDGFASAGYYFKAYGEFLKTERGKEFFKEYILPEWEHEISEFGRGRYAGFLSAYGE